MRLALILFLLTWKGLSGVDKHFEYLMFKQYLRHSKASPRKPLRIMSVWEMSSDSVWWSGIKCVVDR